MNTRQTTTMLLILLMLFQSFSAVASLLDFHVVDTQHLQQEHHHSQDNIPTPPMTADNNGNNVESGQHNPADCHHCGHCNGTHLHWVVQNAANKPELLPQAHHFSYLNTMIDSPVSQLLRPPKHESTQLN